MIALAALVRRVDSRPAPAKLESWRFWEQFSTDRKPRVYSSRDRIAQQLAEAPHVPEGDNR